MSTRGKHNKNPKEKRVQHKSLHWKNGEKRDNTCNLIKTLVDAATHTHNKIKLKPIKSFKNLPSLERIELF